MSFKIHLLVISIIILTFYFITQIFMTHKLEPQSNTPSLIKGSPYTITIERASWGANCHIAPTDKNNNSYLQSDDVNKKTKENNVIKSVAQLCNGKAKCDILINPNTLGEDPFPACMYKILQVEYRCFSVDRLRKKEATEGVLAIDCDKHFSVP